METGITILDAIKREFDCGGADIRTYSPLALAYIGDAVYDLVIRTVVVERATVPPTGCTGRPWHMSTPACRPG